MNNIKIFESKISGPKICIMSGVHGDEKAGIEAMKILEKDLKILKGKVFFVYANELAMQKNVRQVNVNINRLFGNENLKKQFFESYEVKRVESLENILDECNILLDLHNTFNENSEPFLIASSSQFENIFEGKYIVSGLDELHPGGSDSYMNKKGKIGLCYESGNLSDQKAVFRCIEAIKNILIKLNMLEGKIKNFGKKQNIFVERIYKAETKNIVFPKKYNDFDKIKKGEILFFEDGKPVFSQKDYIILFPKLPEKIGDEICVVGYIN